MVTSKELVVVFGNEKLRRHYINMRKADPLLVIAASYPEILGVMQVGESVSIKVVRYPVEQWSYVSWAFEDKVADTERRLESYSQKGMSITEEVGDIHG